MNRLIRSLTSLSNLGKGRPSGQMATLLILVTVMLLAFVLVTLNIGQMSLNRTAVSNAADNSALLLGSQLATKSRQLYEGLEGFEICQKTGFASMILAIVVAIIAIVLTVITYGGGAAVAAAGFMAVMAEVSTMTLVVAGAVGGAIGGAIGGSMTGTGALMGAVQGAMIGGCLGYAAAGIAGSFAGGMTSTTTTSTVTVGEGGVSSATATTGGTASGMGVATETGTMSVGSGFVADTAGMQLTGTSIGLGTQATLSTGFLIKGALFFGSAAYNTYSADQMVGKVMDKIMSMLGKATERDRMREMSFFKALTALVDDPTIAQDTNDSDGDGDTSEYVPKFQVWLYERAKGAMQNTGANYAFIENNIVPLMTNISGWLSRAYLGTDAGGVHTPAWMEVAEYRWVYDPTTAPATDTIIDNMGPPTDPYVNDGPITAVFRALAAHGYTLTSPPPGSDNVFVPGPTYAAYKAYLDIPCDPTTGCGSMPGSVDSTFDEMDGMVAGIREGVAFMEAFLSEPAADRDASWTSWMYMLYDPGLDATYDPNDPPSGSYYSLFSKYLITVERWQRDVDALKATFPMCIMGPGSVFINPPCKMDPTWSVSFDGLPRDQYMSFWGHLDWLYSILWLTKELYKNSYNALTAATADALTACGGINPVVYSWNDTRGAHSVTVKTGNFIIPYIRKEKHGNWFSGETCMILTAWSDAFQRDQTYVEVSRYDQSKNLSLLGRWNPFNTVKKRSYYHFSCLNEVGLRNP